MAQPVDPREVLAQSLRDAVAGRGVDYDAAIDAVFGLFAGRRVSPASPPPPAPRRAADNGPRRPSQPPPPQDGPSLARELAAARRLLGFTLTEPLSPPAINARRKQLARKFHPDLTNGSSDKMAAINTAADLLLSSLT